MSNYRDDVNEIVWLSERLRHTSHHQQVDGLRLRDGIQRAGVGSTLDDGLLLGDATADRSLHVRKDALGFGDSMAHGVKKSSRVSESLKLGDGMLSRLHGEVGDSLTVGDVLREAVLSSARPDDPASFGDAVRGRKRVRHFIEDGLSLGDRQVRIQRESWVETVLAGDLSQHRMRAKTRLTDELSLGEVSGDQHTTGDKITERVRVSDEVVGLLRASNQVQDALVAWDEPGQWGDHGQAWTAAVSGWAMSRYAPMTFTSLAVIDGVLHGTSRDGVFALRGEGEVFSAELRTGVMDMTGDVLSIPLEAHIEYELVGTASFAVAETQRGEFRQYSYPLNARPLSGAMTNARAVFGRGLRGRHFAYTLRITGQRAYINDWSLKVAPSKRSI